ncbi:MAG: hypothetical protein Q8880_04025 [Bacteroidota bacterium]|nr:hypothetical protein [Bacteroidota bacterium]
MCFLHCVCRGNESNEDKLIAQLLIDNGADLKAKNLIGETPLKLAKNYKKNEMMLLLKEAKK